jgi:phage-related minor tail protein
MASGMGLMAEAGPEAVLPLKKGPGGRLGVESIGAQKIQVIVNNNAGVDIQQSQRTGDDGSLQVILDIVRQDIAGQLSRPGTQINKALGLAANPVRAR